MTVPPALTAQFSLGEMYFYLTRAGVGVGAPFGVAEDFAEMAVSVARMGIDPSTMAAAALTALASGDSSSEMEMCDNRLMATGGGVLSSLFAGGAVCDHLSTRPASSVIEVKRTDCPLLVAACLCTMTEGAYMASWPDVTMVIEGGMPTLVVAPDLSAVSRLSSTGTDMSICSGAQPPEAPALLDDAALKAAAVGPLNEGVRMDKAAWAVVYECFRHYLVPSSEQDRATAAGAGLVDTD